MPFDFPSAPTVGTIYAPVGGPTYMWDGTSWTVADGSGGVQPAVIKINSGILSPAGAGVLIPLPTTGFNGLEFYVWDYSPVAFSSPFMRFSWDGGATFPAAANQYYYIWQYQTTAAATPAGSGGTTSAIYFSGGAATAGYKGMGKAWWNIPPPGEMVGVAVDFYSWNNTAYQANHNWASSALLANPPNYMGFYASTGNMSCKWQLNGVR